jgi:hypothetical protein
MQVQVSPFKWVQFLDKLSPFEGRLLRAILRLRYAPLRMSPRNDIECLVSEINNILQSGGRNVKRLFKSWYRVLTKSEIMSL